MLQYISEIEHYNSKVGDRAMESAKRNSWAIYWLYIMVLLTLAFCNYQSLVVFFKDPDVLILGALGVSIVIGTLLLGCFVPALIGGITQVDEDDLFGAMIVCELVLIILSISVGLFCTLIFLSGFKALIIGLTVFLTSNITCLPILSWVASPKK